MSNEPMTTARLAFLTSVAAQKKREAALNWAELQAELGRRFLNDELSVEQFDRACSGQWTEADSKELA